MADALHDRRVRKDCVLTLCNLSFATNSAQMTTDGATHTLCELCDLRSAISMERISIVFRNLASHQGNVRRMVGAGVVPTLVAIASKGSLDTKIHCMIGLCLISFEPTVRLTMSEEGAIPAIMELSSYIGTRAAVHYCGMAISNIAAESKAQGILVKAGAISTLMAWMDQASHSGHKKNGSKEQTEEELMHEARQRVQVPLVEEGELEALSERFDEPKVQFEEKSLPWRKFHIQLRVSEPESPPLPNIQRPVIVTRKSKRRSVPKEKPKSPKSNAMGKKKGESSSSGLIGRPPNPADVENEKILERAKKKMDNHSSSALQVTSPNEELVADLRKKDNHIYAKRNEISISVTKSNDNDRYREGHGTSGSNAGNTIATGEGGFEALFESMRTGEHPIVESSPVVPETGSPTSNGASSTHDDGYERREHHMMGGNEVNNEVFMDFETTMQEVQTTTANSTFGSVGFGEEDFFKHLDHVLKT